MSNLTSNYVLSFLLKPKLIEVALNYFLPWQFCTSLYYSNCKMWALAIIHAIMALISIVVIERICFKKVIDFWLPLIAQTSYKFIK